MKLAQLFCFLYMVISLGCNFRADGKSDEDRRKECEEECASMTSMPSLQFSFMHYSPEEIDTVIVKEISFLKKDTTIYTIIKRQNTGWELNKEIPLKNEYLIIVKGGTPHVIKNFKMGAHPLCNMFDCDFEPRLAEWEVDGETFDYAGITIWKK